MINEINSWKNGSNKTVLQLSVSDYIWQVDINNPVDLPDIQISFPDEDSTFTSGPEYEFFKAIEKSINLDIWMNYGGIFYINGSEVGKSGWLEINRFKNGAGKLCTSIVMMASYGSNEFIEYTIVIYPDKVDFVSTTPYEDNITCKILNI